MDLPKPNLQAQHASVNFFADPFAVRELLLPGDDGKTRMPLDRFLLAGLDITTSHELPFADYQSLVDPSFAPSQQGFTHVDRLHLTHFTSSFLERTRQIMLTFGKDGMELHDVVAVWCAIDNPPAEVLNKGWIVTERKFNIER